MGSGPLSAPTRNSPDGEQIERGTQSTDRATLILRLVAARHAAGVTLATLVRRSGLNRTTAYRIASSLQRAGLIERDPETHLYRLGVEAMALGLASMHRPPLARIYTPAMRALAESTGEHVFLVVRAGDYSQCIGVEEGRNGARNASDVAGTMRLLGLGVPSFVFLGRMTDAEALAHHERNRDLYLGHGMTTIRLLRWVRHVRRLGYAEVVGRRLGGVGLAVPMGFTGEAALGVVVPTSRMSRSAATAFIAAMRRELKSLRPEQGNSEPHSGAPFLP
jgi:DNA-binding IclR family transcriptional regulator